MITKFDPAFVESTTIDEVPYTEGQLLAPTDQELYLDTPWGRQRYSSFIPVVDYAALEALEKSTLKLYCVLTPDVVLYVYDGATLHPVSGVMEILPPGAENVIVLSTSDAIKRSPNKIVSSIIPTILSGTRSTATHELAGGGWSISGVDGKIRINGVEMVVPGQPVGDASNPVILESGYAVWWNGGSDSANAGSMFPAEDPFVVEFWYNNEWQPASSTVIGTAGTYTYSATEIPVVKAIVDFITAYVDKNTPDAARPTIQVTYAELKALRDAGALLPGAYYEMTDYEAIYLQPVSEEVLVGDSNYFNLLLEAVAPDKLHEDGFATATDRVQPTGSWITSSTQLAQWKVRYCLDNDTTRFAWATPAGKGVIYRLVDDRENDICYDFYNIKFRRWNVTSYTSTDSETGKTMFWPSLSDGPIMPMPVMGSLFAVPLDIVIADTYGDFLVSGIVPYRTTITVMPMTLLESGSVSLPNIVVLGDDSVLMYSRFDACYTISMTTSCRNSSFMGGGESVFCGEIADSKFEGFIDLIGGSVTSSQLYQTLSNVFNNIRGSVLDGLVYAQHSASATWNSIQNNHWWTDIVNSTIKVAFYGNTCKNTTGANVNDNTTAFLGNNISGFDDCVFNDAVQRLEARFDVRTLVQRVTVTSALTNCKWLHPFSNTSISGAADSFYFNDGTAIKIVPYAHALPAAVANFNTITPVVPLDGAVNLAITEDVYGLAIPPVVGPLTINIDVPEIYANKCRYFEVWLNIDDTSGAVTFPNTITWLTEPDTSANGLYVFKFRTVPNESAIIGNLAYALFESTTE